MPASDPASEPAASEPAASELAGPEPAAPEPTVSEPAVPEPNATEPAATVPAAVLAAFGLAQVPPVRRAGGQGTAWLAGSVVLKPADLDRADRWNADVYDTLTGPGFRVPRPIRAVTGDWIAHGWTAWQRGSGAAADWSGVSPRWPELIAGRRALHAALAAVPVPRWRVTQDIPWTVGDQVAWGERDPDPAPGPAAGRPARRRDRRAVAPPAGRAPAGRRAGPARARRPVGQRAVLGRRAARVHRLLAAAPPGRAAPRRGGGGRAAVERRASGGARLPGRRARI